MPRRGRCAVRRRSSGSGWRTRASQPTPLQPASSSARYPPVIADCSHRALCCDYAMVPGAAPLGTPQSYGAYRCKRNRLTAAASVGSQRLQKLPPYSVVGDGLIVRQAGGAIVEATYGEILGNHGLDLLDELAFSVVHPGRHVRFDIQARPRGGGSGAICRGCDGGQCVEICRDCGEVTRLIEGTIAAEHLYFEIRTGTQIQQQRAHLVLQAIAGVLRRQSEVVDGRLMMSPDRLNRTLRWRPSRYRLNRRRSTVGDRGRHARRRGARAGRDACRGHGGDKHDCSAAGGEGGHGHTPPWMRAVEIIRLRARGAIRVRIETTAAMVERGNPCAGAGQMRQDSLIAVDIADQPALASANLASVLRTTAANSGALWAFMSSLHCPSSSAARLLVSSMSLRRGRSSCCGAGSDVGNCTMFTMPP